MAGVSLGATLLLAGHAAVPAATGPAVTSSAPVAAGASAVPALVPAGAMPPAQELRFIYQTVVLPRGRQGSDYEPRAIIQGGVAPYAFTIEGKFPQGLELTPQGVLVGVPAVTGSYSFVLKARDASNPPLLTQQPYVLRVVGPRAEHASRSPAPRESSQPTLATITRDEAAAVPDPHRGQPMSYKLTPEGIARLVALVAPEEAPAAAPSEAEPTGVAAVAEPPTPPAPALATKQLPSAEQLGALLQPLQDIEFPTHSLFNSALQAAHCAHYRAQLKHLAEKKGVAVDARCPPAPPMAAELRPRTRPAPSGEMPLPQFYAELLPAELRAEVVREAATVHPLAEAGKVEWTSTGCGCAEPRQASELVYGFHPYWHATDRPRNVDFSLLNRVSYMGLVLNDAGGFDAPANWAIDRVHLVREARRHNTAVDLVLYRRDWGTLLQLPQAKLNEFTRSAVTHAVAAADVPLHDAEARFAPALRPFSNDPAQAYNGLTVFFEDSPTDAEGKKRFRQFFRGFMTQLIEELQRSGRRYFLNVAIPDQEMGEQGAYPFRDLIDYIERASPPGSSHNNAGASIMSAVHYKGTTDITVKYLVLLSSPSDDYKKHLRAAIDHADGQGLQGHRRIAFLESVVPMLFYRRAEAPEPMSPVEVEQLDKDLAYIKWTYGDVAVWPLPEPGIGTGEDVNNRLAYNFAPAAGAVDWLCRRVCPNRGPLYLLLLALMTANGSLVAAYLWNCKLRQRGRTYLMLVWGSGLSALLIAFALLSCDPDLARWREANYLLYVLIAVLCAGGLYATFRRQAEAP